MQEPPKTSVKSTIIRLILLLGVGLPLTTVMIGGLLTRPLEPHITVLEIVAVIAAGYLGTVAFFFLSLRKPAFVYGSIAFYGLFILGMVLSYEACPACAHSFLARYFHYHWGS